MNLLGSEFASALPNSVKNKIHPAHSPINSQGNPKDSSPIASYLQKKSLEVVKQLLQKSETLAK